MPRAKKPTVEIVRADRALAVLPVVPSKLEALLDGLVQERVAEALSRNEGFALESHFSTKRVSDDIRRHQTVLERRKWTAYFKKWGCIICQRKNVIHEGGGYCGRCRTRIVYRLKSIEREVSKDYGREHRDDPIEQITGRVRTAERLLGKVAKGG